MKRLQVLAVAAALAVGTFGVPLAASAEEIATPEQAASVVDDDAAPAQDDIVVLYTNDVHNAYVRSDSNGRIGYAGLAAYKKSLEDQGYTVTLVDGGDAIQGEAIGTISHGKYIVDIMNKVGYDIAAIGNHEFDFGMDTFLDLANNEAQYDYLSCNFIDLRTGKTVFEPYEIADYNGVKVAYLGISTPESFTKSTPTYFQDENGNYIYSFCEGNNGQDLYDCVQRSIDAAKAEGAQYVIAVGHCGVDPASTPWTSEQIIAGTTGLTAFLDAHSHTVLPAESVTDKGGNAVAVCSTGTKFANIGKLVLHSDGTVSTELVAYGNEAVANDDPEVKAYVDEITASFDELLNTVVAHSDVDLVVNDPDGGKRLVRSQETNLGDLCADAYRAMSDADIAFVNGGGIRDIIHSGDITYGNIIAVHPFGNALCMVEATGQQIADALELASRGAGVSEIGGFLHVSGLSYEIDTTVPTSVVLDDKNSFVKVDGARRVKNIMVGDAPLDLTATYKLASHNYMLKSGGDGFSMFQDDKLLLNETMLDNQVLINYITDTLGGNIAANGVYADPYGQGRIKVIVDYKAPTETEDGYQVIQRGTNGTVTEVLPATGATPTATPVPTAAPTAVPTAVPTAKPADDHGDIGPAIANGTWGKDSATATPAPAAAASVKAKTSAIPQTSDDSQPAAVLVVMCLAGLAFAGTSVAKRRQK